MNTGKNGTASEMSNIFHFHSQFSLPLGVTRSLQETIMAHSLVTKH